MPRLPRVHLEGVLYYVTCRGDAAQPLFHEQQDYEVYTRLLEQYRQRYAFKLFAYCLLPDHVHLCLELSADGGTISAVMHDLTTRYTKYFNKRYSRSGHLFQERFRSVIVEKAPYLVPLTAYLHLHPVRSGLVKEPAEYRFNSYPHYLSGGQWAAGPDLTTTIPEVFAGLPSPEIASGNVYAQYVSRLSSNKELEMLREGLQRRILGSDEFVEQIRSHLKDRRHAEAQPVTAGEPQLVPVPVRRSLPRPGWAMAMAGVMLAFGLSALAIRQMAGPGQTVVLIAPGNQTTLPARVAMAVHGGLADEVAILQGSEWEIQLIPMHGLGRSAAHADQLTFTQTQVFSKTLTTDGYPSSNYLVSRQPDGRLVWETIQTDRKGEMVSWKGEWQGTVMQGTMTRQQAGRAPQQFTFVGVLKPAEATRSET